METTVFNHPRIPFGFEGRQFSRQSSSQSSFSSEHSSEVSLCGQHSQGDQLVPYGSIQNSGWSLWNVLSSTIYEVKVGMSYVLPMQFSMTCQAFIQEDSDNETFGLAVVCCRSDKKQTVSLDWPTKDRVGGSYRPRLMGAGNISVRLLSSEFEADTIHGEHPALTKIEHEFRGREFEKQFACRFKRRQAAEGVFGKVLVESLHENGQKETVFEFNLTKSGGKPRRSSSSSSLSSAPVVETKDRWSLLAVKELATMLHIIDHENWKTLAKHLGFTEHEIVVQLSASVDPFHAMLSGYQARGGTPDEFVRGLYEVSRKLNLESAKFDDSEDKYRMELMKQQNSRKSSQAEMEDKTEVPVSEDEEDEDCDRATVPITDLVPPISTPLALTPPLTPPLTPLKRKANDDSNCSPSKRVMRTIDLTKPHDLTDVNCNNDKHRSCDTELSDGVLWQVSNHVQRDWKRLGRELEVKEVDLLCLESATQSKDNRECCYRTLLKWRSEKPRDFKYGVLYSALCDIGLPSTALKCCIVPDINVQLPKA